MMRLTPALEDKLWQDIQTLEGETKMPYVTSVERMAIERGYKKGIEQGIELSCRSDAVDATFQWLA